MENTSYECRRCGYSTIFKCALTKHLHRKKTCEATKEDVTVDILLKELTKQCYNDKTYDCQFCGRKFNAYQNRHKHQKICKINPGALPAHTMTVLEELRTELSQIEVLKNEVAQLKQQLLLPTAASNITHNNGTMNTYNIQNNITLNNYGRETIEHLSKEFLTDCFVRQDIPTLIENMLYDKEVPENRTVRLKSIKNKLVEVHKDNNWVTQSSETVLNDLVDQGSTILRKHYRKNEEDVRNELSEEELEDVLRWLWKVIEDNEKIRKPIKESLLAVLDTYRSSEKFVSV